MLELTRTYKNTDEDILRVDSIMMLPTTSGMMPPFQNQTYARNLNTRLVLGATSREVSSIEISTSADEYEDSSGDYLWVGWSSRGIRCDMSDLPGVGDDV